MAGRPPKYNSVEEMESIIDKYFDENKDFPTMAGLAYALGMCRQTMLNYAEKDEFMDTIKRARQRVEISLEKQLYGSSVAGAIFNLKNNFGWRDVKENFNTNTNRTVKDMTDEELDEIIARSGPGEEGKAASKTKPDQLH